MSLRPIRREALPPDLKGWCDRHFGSATALLVQASGNATWLIAADEQAVVAKRLEPERAPTWFIPMLVEAHRLGIAPPVLDWVESDPGWIAIAELVPGPQARPEPATWSVLESQLAGLLQALSMLSVPPLPDVLDGWLSVLGRHEFGDPDVGSLQQAMLRDRPAVGSMVVAHGDFSFQNVILTEGRAVLIDWQQAGIAPDGFDLGFLLALMRSGWPQVRPLELRRRYESTFGRAPLSWFVQLGLFRLLYRCQTMQLDPDLRRQLERQIRQELLAEPPTEP